MHHPASSQEVCHRILCAQGLLVGLPNLIFLSSLSVSDVDIQTSKWLLLLTLS